MLWLGSFFIFGQKLISGRRGGVAIRMSRCLFSKKIIYGVGTFILESKVYKKILWPLFMNRIQLSEDLDPLSLEKKFWSLSLQEFLVLIWLTSNEWKTESTLEPPTGFPGLLNWESSALTTRPLLQICFELFLNSWIGNEWFWEWWC